MEPDTTLAQTNVDDVVGQAADDAAETLDAGDTRLGFLKKAGLAGGAVVGGGALIGALTPAAAIAAPKVDFGSTTSSEASFVKTAVALENTGVHAYSGQALNIAGPAYIAAALSIWSIEARHASVAGLLLTGKPSGITPDGPFDTPFTAAEVLKAVKKTGFLR
jgi:hypothetical protein